MNRPDRKTSLSILFCTILLVSSILILTHASVPSTGYYLDVPFGDASYYIDQFTNGTYFMVNCSTWQKAYSSTNCSQVLTFAFGNMSSISDPQHGTLKMGTVFMRAGRYTLDSTVSIPQGCSLRGESMEATILYVTTAVDPVLQTKVGSRAYGYATFWYSCISDLTIASSTESLATTGIYALNTAIVQYERVKFYQIRYGLHVDGGCDNVYGETLYFRSVPANGIGIWFDTFNASGGWNQEGLEFHNIYVHHPANNSTGILFYGDDGKKCFSGTIDGLTTTGNATMTDTYGMYLKAGSGSVYGSFSNIDLETEDYGVYFASGGRSTFHNLRIYGRDTGNTIYGVACGGHYISWFGGVGDDGYVSTALYCTGGIIIYDETVYFASINYGGGGSICKYNYTQVYP